MENPAVAVSGVSEGGHAARLTKSEINQTTDRSQADCDNLLGMIRRGSLRLSLARNELHCIGIALKSGMLTPDSAVSWLYDEGLDGVVGLPEQREVA